MKHDSLLFIFIICSLIIACNPSKQSPSKTFSFSEWECNPEPMPEYDGREVTLLDDNQQPIKDTVFYHAKKKRDAFKPCRQLIYRAIWKDESGNIITKSRIKMMASGVRWELQPLLQDEIIIQYEFSESEITNATFHQLNKGILNRPWNDQVREGIIENEEKVWMHPFRFNQYNFTEVAPFPEVQYPLYVGRSWSGNLNIMQGWGDWAHTRGNMSYEIVGQEDLKTKYGTIPQCWRIQSKAIYPFGNSELEFWFSEDLGFVKKEYKNYGNQTLSIELEEVILPEE